MTDSPWIFVLLLIVGVFAGTLNVLAGGGSLLSLPVLIFAGLPSVEANGTNRVAILMQNLVATWRFQRHGIVPWSIVWWAALPATGGSLLGARWALAIDDRQFQRVLVLIMVAVTVFSMVRQGLRRRGAGAAGLNGGAKGSDSGPVGNREINPEIKRWMLAAGFFAVGVYGGFVQAGVGFLILASLSMVGLDLVRGNAVKVVAVLCFTVVALWVFAMDGQVHWLLGGVLGIGNALGAVLGVRLTVLKGNLWIERLVTVTVLVFAVALWMRS